MNKTGSIDAPYKKHGTRYSSQDDYQAMQELRSLWRDSESVLGILRTVSKPIEEPDVALLRGWDERRVNATTASPWAREPDPSTPNGWFQERFPAETEKWGNPFLQKRHVDRDGLPRTELLAINEDFFGRLLGGEKARGHQVILYAPEKTFYFWDCAREKFVPTTQEKLKLLISRYMVQCAQSMSTLVNVEPLYKEFRSEKCLGTIIQKAEAMHQADESFFQDLSHPRVGAPAKEMVPKLFVKETLAVQPKAVLTVNECFERHLGFCDARGLTPLQRKEFKGLIADVIREEFGVGLRHDLRSEDGRTAQGWSNVTVRKEVLLAN